MRTLPLAAALVLLAGCGPEESPLPTGGTPGGTVGGTAGGTPGGTTSGTTESTAPTPVFDCATVPSGIEPGDVAHLGAPRGYHDVDFTPDGRIIGNNSSHNAVIAVDDQDNVQNFVDGLGTVQQMVWMPDGDLAVASDGTGGIHRVTPTGVQSLIKPNVYAYGLIMGPDDMLWAANYTEVMRIDPATGGSETILSSLPNGQPRVIQFNLDFTKLYIGTLSGNGNVFSVNLDANYNVDGPVEIFATGVGTGSYHDGLGIDVCGYLYMPDYGSTALYRISPDGTVQTMWDGSLNEYPHGLEWGNGVGPWRTDALYLPQPYNNNHVIEIVIGIPKEFDGDVINRP